MPKNNNIQFRRGTADEWTNTNPVLATGEPGFETDTNLLKIGLGAQWDETRYLSASSLSTVVFNNTGSTIPKMSVVYITGGQGDRPTVGLALASGEVSSSKTYGITATDILDQDTGSVVINGALVNLNTTQFSPNTNGTALWLSPTVSGGITTSKPYAPYHMVFVGTIIRSHAQEGTIEVKIQNGYELEELHNVATTGATNGQFLQYNSGSGLWMPSSSGNFTTLSINGASVATDNSSIVRTTGDQTIGGIKSFNSQPVFNSGILAGGQNRFTISQGSFGFTIDRGDLIPETYGDALKLDVDPDNGYGYSTTLKTSGPAEDILLYLPNSPGTLITDNNLLSIVINAGSGLSGGGNIVQSRTINVGQGDGISVSADSIAVNNTVVRTTGNQTISGIKTFSTVNSDAISATINLSGPAGFNVTDDAFFFVNASNNFNVDTENGFANFFNAMYVDTSNVGIGTTSPGAKLHVIGSGIISGDMTIGGNLVVNGTTVTANVDTVTVEDPVITLGLSSGNIVPNLTYDRGLALIRGTGLTAFMGWDTSENTFVLLSSGVPGANSGTYTAGTYGDLQLNKLNSAEINVNELTSIISSGISFSNFIKFNDTSTPSAPSLGSISNGTRLLLNENNTDGHNAIGIQYAGINGTWFSVPSGGAFTFYNGTSSQLTLNSTSLNYGSFSVNSDGSITSASWNASTIPVNKGGTGRTSYSNGQLLIGSGTSLVANTLTAGTGISITNGSGSITINTSGLQTALTDPVTGTGIANHIPYWSTTSGIVADSGQLYWDSTNNRLGIGTSSPSYRLDVTGSGIFRGTGSSLVLNADGNVAGSPSIEATSTYSDINIKVGGQNIFRGLDGWPATWADSAATTYFQVGRQAGNTMFSSLVGASFNRLAFTSSKTLFTDATSNLPIPSGYFSVIKSSGTLLHIDNNGNIGVGTTSPTSKFHVVGSGLFSSDVRSSGSFIGGSGTALLPSFEFIDDPDTGLFSPAANTFGISTSGVERLLVNNLGNVGIGNSYPNSKLDVVGTFACGTAGGDPSAGGQGLYFDPSVPSLTFNDSSGPNTTLTINNDGLTLYDFVGSPFFYTDRNNARIGIGTSTPSGALDVVGDVNIDGNLTFDSFTESVVANGNSGTSKTLSLASGTVHTCTLTGNCTFTMPTATAGKSFSMFLNSGSGNYTASFSGVRWADSATPTATITASKVDIYSFISDGTYWYGSFSQNYG